MRFIEFMPFYGNGKNRKNTKRPKKKTKTRKSLSRSKKTKKKKRGLVTVSFLSERESGRALLSQSSYLHDYDEPLLLHFKPGRLASFLSVSSVLSGRKSSSSRGASKSE